MKLQNCEVRWRYTTTLSSDRTGLLAKVRYSEGDLVDAEEVVATLDDRTLQARLKVVSKEAESRIAIEAAQKAHEVAKAEWEKALEANRDLEEVIPELEIKRLKLNSERTRLEWDQAVYERELKVLAQEEVLTTLELTKIVAPRSGLVTKVHKNAGEAVQQGEDILEITDLDLLRVEKSIPLAEAQKLKKNQRAFSVVNGVRYEGHVQFIDATVQPLSDKVLVWVELKNTKRQLKAGMKIDLVIQPAETVTKPRNE